MLLGNIWSIYCHTIDLEVNYVGISVIALLNELVVYLLVKLILY